MGTWEYMRRVNNNLRKLNTYNVLQLAKCVTENKQDVLAWKGIDMILGINMIILTDAKEKAKLLNFYFAFLYSMLRRKID